MIGRTISHYEVGEKLGEGGMGVVYKAKDTHLDRLVALKLLPPGKVSDPERIRRFVQEAKAASALNHPNIVTIYDIDTADGVTFIAMEYIQGRTLEQWIRSRGSLGDILKYGGQVASALTAAHAKGIIHRDLKPGNIMISDAGLAKVLDFGLAKLTEVAAAGEDAATRTIRQENAPPTEDGRIVGTASYMAPEQAEGKTVDARTDIFAFGAVLYEMVSGRRAFQGDTAISTLSAILKTDPKPLRELAPNTPGEVERIVTRCLRKDPGKRFQHMDDLKVALDEMREESDSGKLSAVAPTPGRPRRSLVWIAGLIALLCATGLYWRSRTPEKPNSGPVLTRLTTDAGLTIEPAYWPDGKLITYASDRAGGRLDIYVQQLTGGEPHRITSNESDDHEPDFSPDGSKVVFRSEREGGGIYVVPTLGGTERRIADKGRYPKFSPDGKSIAYWVGEPALETLGKIYVMPSAGGTPQQIAAKLVSVGPPVWSPDSKRLAFEGGRRGAKDWFTASVESGEHSLIGAREVLAKQRLLNPVPGAWNKDGITFSAELGDTANLWRVAISDTYQMISPARKLTSGTNRDVQPAISGNRMVYAEMTENADIWTLPIDTNQAKLSPETSPRMTLEVCIGRGFVAG